MDKEQLPKLMLDKYTEMTLKKLEGTKLEFNDYFIYIVSSNKEKGFNFPYILVLPKQANEISTIVVDNKTPRASTLSYKETIEKELIDNMRVSKMAGVILKEFNEPILIPIIPRFKGFYTTALGSNVRNNNMINLKEEIKNGNVLMDPKDLEKLIDIPKQYNNVIMDAKNFLRNNLHLNVNDKVIQTGYSAASKLASNYTELYPENVECLIAGGTTGLGIRPLKEYNYPLGIRDISNYDADASKSVKRFFFIGSNDENDPALCNCIFDEKRDVNGNLKPKFTEDGNIIPILKDNKYIAVNKDCYTDEEVDIIHRKFGSRINDRFKNYVDSLNRFGYNITAKVYDGDHMSVQENKDVYSDITSFLKKNKYNKSNEIIDLKKKKKQLLQEQKNRKIQEDGLKLTYGSKGFMNIILISIIIITISILILFLLKIL